MAPTVGELQARIARIQQDLGEVSSALALLETPGARIADATVEYSASQPMSDERREGLRKAFDAVFEAFGAERPEPIGADELRRRLTERGVRPEDNVFSRGIIEMRDE